LFIPAARIFFMVSSAENLGVPAALLACVEAAITLSLSI
jgi:hypothetical protein